MSDRVRLRRDTSAARALVACAVPFLLAGCYPGDTNLRVVNGSEHAWYLSVERAPGRDDLLWVVRVAPGADGYVFSWNGGETAPVTVLADDCTPVGTLARASDGSWTTPAVQGLVGRMTGGFGPSGSRSTTPGIEDTEDCGGFLAH